MPSHYLNQCWLFINCIFRNKLQYFNSKIFFLTYIIQKCCLQNDDHCVQISIWNTNRVFNTFTTQATITADGSRWLITKHSYWCTADEGLTMTILDIMMIQGYIMILSIGMYWRYESMPITHHYDKLTSLGHITGSLIHGYKQLRKCIFVILQILYMQLHGDNSMISFSCILVRTWQLMSWWQQTPCHQQGVNLNSVFDRINTCLSQHYSC